MSGTMRSYGVVMLPLFIMIISQYAARIGFYFLAYDAMGADAIWWAYNFSSLVAMVLTWAAYRHGPWRKTSIPAAVPQPAE